MIEKQATNRITITEAGAPAHVIALPRDLAKYTDRQTSGPINMYDNRGLLEQPPYVKIGGDLVPGVAKVLIEDGKGVLPVENKVLNIHVSDIGTPITNIESSKPVGSRAKYDHSNLPLNTVDQSGKPSAYPNDKYAL